MISCKEYAFSEKQKLKNQIAALDFIPNLVIIQTTDDKASRAYVNGKIKDATEVGINTFVYSFREGRDDYNGLREFITETTKDKSCCGIIVQKPLCDALQPYENEIDNLIPKELDVDGFGTSTLFTPATARGIMNWLEANNIRLSGQNVVIIGRSKLVGKPLAKLMTDADATVTLCHSKTKNLNEYTTRANIIVSAIGKPRILDDWYFNEIKNQIVVDVGISHEYGKLVGDVDPRVEECVGYLTPVPGGVGLLTRVALLKNVLDAARLKKNV